MASSTPDEAGWQRPSALDAILSLQAAMNAEVLGQPVVVERMVIGMLADGHLLIEGLPGLAKTRAVKAMARHLKADFSRVQFTPDLLPSDVTGTDIYYSEAGKGAFRFQPGPVFGNILLADEINRAPAKVQAALLEAMEERQVTVGQTTHPLPDIFIVMATQNPIEQEGTYPLPEAQTDRFLMKVLVEYPAPDDELGVLRLLRAEEQAALALKPVPKAGGPDGGAATITLDDVFAARREIAVLHVAEAIETYIVDLVNATRTPTRYSEDLGREIELGASPRAGIALDRCARAHAWLQGSDFVSPGDVQAIARDVLRHRIALPRCPLWTRASMSTSPTSQGSRPRPADSTSCRASRWEAHSAGGAPAAFAGAASSSRSYAPTSPATTCAPSTGR
jgi:MoxR-like ATPase